MKLTSIVKEVSNEDHSLFAFRSEIDPDFEVFIIYPENERYREMKIMFEQWGSAFIDLSEKQIFIDGKEVNKKWFTNNHLIFQQAHEIAHSVLKHDSDFDEDQEAEADFVAIQICKARGKYKAATLGNKQFIKRNGIEYKEYKFSKRAGLLLQEYIL